MSSPITQAEMEALFVKFFGPASPGRPPPAGGRTTTTSTPALPSNVEGALKNIIPAEYQTRMDDFRDKLKDINDRAEQLKAGLQNIDEAALDAIEPLRATNLAIQEMYGGFRGANEKMNTEIGQNLRDSYNMFAENITMSTAELKAAGKERFVMEVDGQEVNMLKDIFEDSTEYFTRFHHMVDDYNTTIGPAFSRGLLGNAEDVALIQENFNLTGQELGDFLAKEVALTGEASMTMMDDLKKFSYGLAAGTGENAKLIAKDTVQIVSNVERFGNVTVEQAARMSTALKQLGVDYSQLNNMVGQFQGFEGAAQKVGELSAVFGIHLDAVEMMTLANTDQEAMMHKLKDAFDESGQSLDDMNIAQKNLLTQQAGFTDVKQMEMFFRGEVDSLEELKEMTDEAATDEGTADAMENFNKDLATLSLRGMSAAKRIDKAKNDMVYSFNSIAPAIMDGRGAVMAAGQKLLDEGQAIFTEIPKTVKKAMDTTKKVINDEAEVTDIGATIASGIELAINKIPPAAKEMFGSVINFADQLGILGRSPSPFGMLISGGITHALDEIPPYFQNIISEAVGMTEQINDLIEASGLQDMVETVDQAGVVANANITTLLTEYQNKISEVQGLVDAPDKIVQILTGVADMKDSVELLTKSLQENSAQPIKLSFDSKGSAEKALIGVLKDYVGEDTGRVSFNYENKE